ncbi:unnamed protein product, partial [Scytosiphon promiscuus]
MTEKEEVQKYKRLYEEQKAKVKELERQNSQLKDTIQHLMAVGRQQGGAVQKSPSYGNNNAGNSAATNVTKGVPPPVAGADGNANPRAARARPAPPAGRSNNLPAPPHAGNGGGGRGGGRGNGMASGGAAPGNQRGGGGQVHSNSAGAGGGGG